MRLHLKKGFKSIFLVPFVVLSLFHLWLNFYHREHKGIHGDTQSFDSENMYTVSF
jgi:hypothetical protein